MLSSSKVIDANVILRPDGLDLSEKYLTTPKVLDEIKSSEGSLNLAAFTIEVFEPSDQYVNKVKKVNESKNGGLSEEDVSVVALALERNATVYTDDRELQNICAHLGVEYESIYGSIDEEREWVNVCPRCGREVEQDVCSWCGFDGEFEKRRDH